MVQKDPIFVGNVKTNMMNMSNTKQKEGNHTLNVNLCFVCIKNKEINALSVKEAVFVIIEDKGQNAKNATGTKCQYDLPNQPKQASVIQLHARNASTDVARINANLVS